MDCGDPLARRFSPFLINDRFGHEKIQIECERRLKSNKVDPAVIG